MYRQFLFIRVLFLSDYIGSRSIFQGINELSKLQSRIRRAATLARAESGADRGAECGLDRDAELSIGFSDATTRYRVPAVPRPNDSDVSRGSFY